MRSIMLAALAVLALASTAQAASGVGAGRDGPRCTRGVPCGNTCIAKGKTCHVSTAPQCSTGVPCGKTCIAKEKVCHQPL